MLYRVDIVEDSAVPKRQALRNVILAGFLRARHGLWLALVVLAVGLGLSACGDSRSGGTAGVGSDAKLFLTATPYDRLVVEVDYVETHPPSQAALALLETRLAERLNKPGGIVLFVDDAIPPVVSPTTRKQISALEARHRDFRAEGDQAAIYVLYLNGEFTNDTEVWNATGLAYGPSSFCIFKETVDQVASRLVAPVEVERATLVHELGHLLGLVNFGTPMVENHEDPAHRGHDVNVLCVMHHEIETANVRVLLENGGAPFDDFDAECIADLRAYGGK